MSKYIYLNSFMVCGPRVRTKNSDEFNSATARLPKLWETFFSSHRDETLATQRIFGVYSDYESDHNGHYTVTAGLNQDLTADHQKFPSIEIAAGHYLIFESDGATSEHIVATWQTIWNYFEKNETDQRNYQTDFEVYSRTDKAAIYIGVKI